MPLEPIDMIATRTAALSGFKGYDPKLFVNPIDGDFFCSLCSGVLRQGVVINGDPCGSIFCDYCLHEQLNVRMVCPKDHRPLVLDDVFPLDLVNQKIKKLQVRCHIAPTRCTVTGEIGEHEEWWRAHEPVCDFAPLECRFCHELYLRRDHDRHETHECVQRLITCVACQRHDIKAMDMDTHLLTCPDFETNRLRYDFKRMQQIMSDMQNDLLKNQEAIRQSELARKADARIAAEATKSEVDCRAREITRMEQLVADEAASRQAEDGALIAALRRQYDELVAENHALHAKIEEADQRLQIAIAPKADKAYCDSNFAQIISDFKAEDTRLHARVDKCEQEYRANHERIQEIVRTIDAETKSMILDLDVKQRRTVEELRLEVLERKADVARVEDLIRQADAERRVADDRLDESIRRFEIEQKAETQKVVVELRHHVGVLREETLKAVSPYFPAIAQLRSEMLVNDEQLGNEIRQETQERIVAVDQVMLAIQKVDAEHVAEEQRLQVELRRQEGVIHTHNDERKVDVARLEVSIQEVDQRRAADVIVAETARAKTEVELKEEIDVLRVQMNELELSTTLLRREDQSEFRSLHATAVQATAAVEQSRLADVRRIDLDIRNEIDARKEEVLRVEGVIRKHYFEHKATEQELDTYQKNVSAVVTKEIADRAQADEALSVRIDAECKIRESTDVDINARLLTEIEERKTEIHPFYQHNQDRIDQIAALDKRLVEEGVVFRAEDVRLDQIIKDNDFAQRQATVEVNAALQQTNYALSVADAERRADTQRIESAAQKAELERRADNYRFTEAVRLSEVERKSLDVRLCDSIKEMDARFIAEDQRLDGEIKKTNLVINEFMLESRKEVNRIDAAIGSVETARVIEDARLDAQHKALVQVVSTTDAAAVALAARVTTTEEHVKVLYSTTERLDSDIKAEAVVRADCDTQQVQATEEEIKQRLKEVSRLDDEVAAEKAERLEKEGRVEEQTKATNEENNVRFQEVTVEQTRIMENFRAAEIERKVTATRMLQSLSQQEADRKASETRILDDLRRSDLERRDGELKTSQALRSLEVERRADVERTIDQFKAAEHARIDDSNRAEEALRAARNELKNELLALSVAEQRTAEALRAAEFERKAAAERLAEDWRHAEVERRTDADAAAEHLRGVEKAAKADNDRLSEEIRRFTVEVRSGLHEAQHESRKCTELVRQAEADRKADIETMNALIYKQQSQQKGEVPLLQSQLKKTSERLLQEENDRKADTERAAAAIAKTDHAFDEFRQLFNDRLEQLERGVTSVTAVSQTSRVTIKTPSGEETSRPMSSTKNSALLLAEQAAVPKGGRYHTGQWRKHRLLEYWSCCQTPSTGDKAALGCQIKQ